MTRLILSPFLLDYHQEMMELVHHARQKPAIDGVRPQARRAEPCPPPGHAADLYMAGVLAPPLVENLWISIRLRDGALSGVIQIVTADEFGVTDVYVTLLDEQGRIVESGYAMQVPCYGDYWGYIPSASVAPGTTLTVRAVAMDCLGATGMLTERVTVE